MEQKSEYAVYSASDLLSIGEELEKEKKERRLKKGKGRVYFDGKWFEINGMYDIEASRISSPGSALDWIHQLHEKTWMTDEMMREFIDIVFDIIPGRWWQGK